MKITLASSSPRRRELLTKIGLQFEVVPSTKDEIIEKGLTPEKVTEHLATQKAEDVFSREKGLCIGADTIVVFNGEIIGKPKNREHAKEMLKKLSGNTHRVITGYCVKNGEKEVIGHEISEVTFNLLTSEQIDGYVDKGYSDGKAGGYGIQDGFGLVKGYKGSFDNIVGLPTERIVEVLKGFGVEVN